MLREYQKELARRAYNILKNLRIVYLAAEMRVGKTLVALEAAKLLNARTVLFITKKKAIQSIIDDYNREVYGFQLTVTNYEQAGKLSPMFDVIVVDEAHSLGAFPKPSKRTVIIKNLVRRNYLILLSGTPSPESYSQLYHQFWVSEWSPFAEQNFYHWAKSYVNVKEVMYNGVAHKDYSRANKELTMSGLKPYFITYTREQAGFIHNNVQETIITVPIDNKIYTLVDILLRKFYYRFTDGREVVCDTAVKLQSKIHQIFSGTVKTEDGGYKILDPSKAEYIRDNYQGLKIAVFYKFVAEGEALKTVLPNITDNPEEFQSTDKIFVSQIQSGSMGINLSAADVLIFYNIDFSAVQYWQARARLQALERTRIPQVHWLFSENGIEHKVYQCVQKKKDYTNYYFKKDYLNGKREYLAKQDSKVASQQRTLC
jgi:hypothetical protein